MYGTKKKDFACASALITYTNSLITSPLTSSVFGGGFFPRQRLDSVQEAFLLVLRSSCGLASSSERGSRMLKLSTMSRHSGLSPAMFPSAHTAWREGGREGRGGEGGREGRGGGREGGRGGRGGREAGRGGRQGREGGREGRRVGRVGRQGRWMCEHE